MRIAKPLLLITTPIGVVMGIYEAFRLTGGLAFLMIALVLMMSAAAAMVVSTVRREQREDELRKAPPLADTHEGAQEK